MSKEYDNTNRGALFVNNRKEKDNHPDYTGTIDIRGEEYYISGWKKEGRTGTFLSLSVKPKQVRDGFLDQTPTNAPTEVLAPEPRPDCAGPLNGVAPDDVPF